MWLNYHTPQEGLTPLLGVSRDRDPQFTLREVIAGCGAAAGATRKDVADAMGISERKVYEVYELFGQYITEIQKAVSPLIRVNKREIERVAKEDAAAKFEALLGKALSAIERATDSDDPKTALEGAKEVLNRLMGKAASNLHVSGGVNHAHLHAVIPPETVAALNAVAAKSSTLYLKAAQFDE